MKPRRIVEDDEEEAQGSEKEKDHEDKEQEDGDDDEDEDDDDDEEEDEDDDDEESPHRKRKRAAVREFMLDEAEVDDDAGDEDDDDYEEEGELIGREVDEVVEAGPTAREIDSRRRLQDIINAEDEEAIERYYQQRYAESNLADQFGGGEEMADDITQQERLPGVKDANLWLVRCRLGEEKMVVLQLMRKMIALQYTDNPLQIKSAIAKEGLRGYIYIEALKQTHVKQAIEGVGALQIGRWKQQMVPINEMTDVLRVIKETGRLHPNQWVRIKRGVFRDDLAQVEEVEDAQNKVYVKLVPRIDYGRKRGALRHEKGDDDETGGPGANLNALKRFRRSPLAQFDRLKVMEIGGLVQREGDFYLFEGNRYDARGFLHKAFPLNAIISEGVKPSLHELERFNEDPEHLKIDSAMLKGPGEVEHSFAPGDVIEVCVGDLKNLRGRVLTVDGNQVTVLPSHVDLKEPIPFAPGELRKHFDPGNHVKVIAGRFENETGLVIRFDPAVAVVLSDLTMSELKVAPKDLRLCQDRATGVDSSGHYQLGDLIQVDPQTVGVIVRIEKEEIAVLTVHGKVINLKVNAVLRRRESRNARAMDCENNYIQARDMVHVVDGPHSGQQGEIRHIFRSWAFIYSRMILENGGLFVARTRLLSLRGGTGSGGGVGGGSNSGLSNSGGVMSGGGYAPQSPRLHTPDMRTSPNQSGTPTPTSGGGRSPLTDLMGGSRRGGGGGQRGGGMSQKQRDREMIGKTARIIRGPLKGLIGMIKDVTESEVYLELHSQFKSVYVLKENIAMVDRSGRIVGSRFGASTPWQQSSTWGGRTPAPGGQTPGYGGSRTPMYGSQTPLLDAGSRTPHYGSQTPRHDAGGGGATPRPGGFDPAGATPAHQPYDELFEGSPVSSVITGELRSPMGASSLPAFNPATPVVAGTSLSPALSSPSLSGGSQLQRGTSPHLFSPLVGGGGGGSSTPGSLIHGGGNTPFTPSGLAMGMGGGDTPGQYDLERMNVDFIQANTVVRAELPGGELVNRAVVTGMNGGQVSLMLPEEDDRLVQVSIDCIYRAVPEAGELVRLLNVDKPGIIEVGQILSIENGEGVVKLEPDGTLKLCSLRQLAPYVHGAAASVGRH